MGKPIKRRGIRQIKPKKLFAKAPKPRLESFGTGVERRKSQWGEILGPESQHYRPFPGQPKIVDMPTKGYFFNLKEPKPTNINETYRKIPGKPGHHQSRTQFPDRRQKKKE